MGYAMRVGCGDPTGGVQKTEMADDPNEAFKVPHGLDVVDLEGKPSPAPLPNGSAGSVGVLGALELEAPNLELESSVHPVQRAKLVSPARGAIPWSWVGGVLVCCGLAAAAYHYVQVHGH